MAIDNKYGQVEIPGVGDDEPVFILRAKDVLAERAIEFYQTLYADSTRVVIGDDLAKKQNAERFLEGLRNVRSAFQAWQGDNAEIVRMPD